MKVNGCRVAKSRGIHVEHRSGEGAHEGESTGGGIGGDDIFDTLSNQINCLSGIS